MKIVSSSKLSLVYLDENTATAWITLLSAVIIGHISSSQQMLAPDNHILSSYSLYSSYTSSTVINSATGECAESGKR